MKRIFLDLPGWSFDVDEVSASVYQVVATDDEGHRFSKVGTDPEMLIAECRCEASNVRFGGSSIRPPLGN